MSSRPVILSRRAVTRIFHADEKALRKLIVEHGWREVDEACRSEPENISLLSVACANGYLQTVTDLLAAGADVNGEDRLNQTPLWHAFGPWDRCLHLPSGSFKSVSLHQAFIAVTRLLIQQGADPTITSFRHLSRPSRLNEWVERNGDVDCRAEFDSGFQQRTSIERETWVQCRLPKLRLGLFLQFLDFPEHLLRLNSSSLYLFPDGGDPSIAGHLRGQ